MWSFELAALLSFVSFSIQQLALAIAVIYIRFH